MGTLARPAFEPPSFVTRKPDGQECPSSNSLQSLPDGHDRGDLSQTVSLGLFGLCVESGTDDTLRVRDTDRPLCGMRPCGAGHEEAAPSWRTDGLCRCAVDGIVVGLHLVTIRPPGATGGSFGPPVGSKHTGERSPSPVAPGD